MDVTQSFTPPSPWTWELEQTHLTKPPSALLAELMPAPMMRGFSEGTRRRGAGAHVRRAGRRPRLLNRS